MKSRREKAVENFKSGCNCAQAVVAAYADVFGLDYQTALLVSQGFGGGMGRLREVCGALSGAIILCGYKKPNSPNKDVYALVQEIAKDFELRNGSIYCRELLDSERATDKSPVPSERTKGYFKKNPCVQIVENAAASIDKVLLEK